MQNLTNYDVSYYKRDIPENWYKELNLPRPDELAAIAYMYGLPFWGDEGLERRNPKNVISVGCGSGYFESQLESMGLEVVGVDPTDGASATYMGRHIVKSIYDVDVKDDITLLFVESVEHIPKEETVRILDIMPVGTRAIFVNWLSHHPIPAVSEWDHITEINDAFFDDISRGWDTIVRRRSHLVIDRRTK